MNKINYGFDAPGFMRNALVFGSAAIGIFFILRIFTAHPIFRIVGILFLIGGLFFASLGVSMLIYGLAGKYRMRDLMLSKINWKGDEKVLDIGSGRGLMLNGAAKFLTTGKAIGIDIWRPEDLSDNTLTNALANAAAEGVSDKIEILNQDAQKIEFPDNSFDVIFSVFCIHNIDDKVGIEKACMEVARVLKPGGTAMVAEWMPIKDYVTTFSKNGLTIKSYQTYFSKAYSLMWMVEVTK